METPGRNSQNSTTPPAAPNLRRQSKPETPNCQTSPIDQAQPNPKAGCPCLKEGSAVQHQPLVQQPAFRSTREPGKLVDIVRTRRESTVERSIQHRSSEVVELSNIAGDPLKLNQAFQESECILLDSPGRKVFRYGDAVFKFGIDVSSFEAETLQFIGTTTIPAPRLYCNCVHLDGTVVIVMEYIKGKLLSDLWPSLHDNEKRKIVRQLREILEKMRQLQGGYIGGINNAPAVDIRMHTRQGGPFRDEEQFNEFLRSTIHSQVPKIIRDMVQINMRTDHNIVLTHGEITTRHIMIDDRQTVVAILDWESAGWYPEHWEFIKFMKEIDYTTDWGNHAPDIFPKIYVNEHLTDSYLNRLLSR